MAVQTSERNRVRTVRAMVKDQIKRGEIPLHEALEHPDLERMLLWDLLVALPGFAGARIDRLFSAIECGPLALVGELDPHQQNVLVYTAQLRRVRFASGGRA